jgi:hypothetical protein
VATTPAPFSEKLTGAGGVHASSAQHPLEYFLATQKKILVNRSKTEHVKNEAE